jgi:hypothetical protein
MYITRITRYLLAVALVAGMGGMALPAEAESARACQNLTASSFDGGAYAEYQRCANVDSILYTGRIYDLMADGLSARIYSGSTLRAAATTANNGRSFSIQSFTPALSICTGKGGNSGECKIMR